MEKKKLTLRQWRNFANLTQGEAAKKIGVSPTTLCNWETGKTTITIPKLKQIMEAYGIEDSGQILMESQKLWNTHKAK